MISKELIEENKKKLLAEQKRIKTVLEREDIKDGPGEFPGEFKPKFDELGNEEGENASEVENFGNQLAVTEQLESQLKKIEWALARIENGTYGICAEGDEIEEERLRALPSAETCIKHAL
jgi:RNA polymerase-binding transcription factor DksA